MRLLGTNYTRKVSSAKSLDEGKVEMSGSDRRSAGIIYSLSLTPRIRHLLVLGNRIPARFLRQRKQEREKSKCALRGELIESLWNVFTTARTLLVVAVRYVNSYGNEYSMERRNLERMRHGASTSASNHVPCVFVLSPFVRETEISRAPSGTGRRTISFPFFFRERLMRVAIGKKSGERGESNGEGTWFKNTRQACGAKNSLRDLRVALVSY